MYDEAKAAQKPPSPPPAFAAAPPPADARGGLQVLGYSTQRIKFFRDNFADFTAQEFQCQVQEHVNKLVKHEIIPFIRKRSFAIPVQDFEVPRAPVRLLSAKAPEEEKAAAEKEPSTEEPKDEAAESSPSIGKRLIDGWEALSARARTLDAKEVARIAQGELRQAYAELTGADRGSVLKTSVTFHDDAAAPAADGAEEVDEREKQLLVIDARDNWEKLRARLKEAPIISDILKGAGKARDAAAATAAGRAAAAGRDRVNDKIEDAREFWETSQNPLVYQASSIVDAVTAETDMAAATRELRRLDPRFSME
ncbi:hypothetical protein AURANDRAFT_69236, partial [Aureococcus anophagefferens]